MGFIRLLQYKINHLYSEPKYNIECSAIFDRIILLHQQSNCSYPYYTVHRASKRLFDMSTLIRIRKIRGFLSLPDTDPDPSINK
jgi:hypothetical protein